MSLLLLGERRKIKMWLIIILSILATLGLWKIWDFTRVHWFGLVGVRLALRRMNRDMRALGHNHGMWVVKKGEDKGESNERFNQTQRDCPVCYSPKVTE